MPLTREAADDARLVQQPRDGFGVISLITICRGIRKGRLGSDCEVHANELKRSQCSQGKTATTSKQVSQISGNHGDRQ